VIVDWGRFAVDSGHYLCLDVLRVSLAGDSKALCDCAILLEIWESGGLLQTSTAIPEGSVLDVASPDGPVRATVNSCSADDYGSLVEFEVDPSASWFPSGYSPPYLRPSDAA
jgi:hypothetical protein